MTPIKIVESLDVKGSYFLREYDALDSEATDRESYRIPANKLNDIVEGLISQLVLTNVKEVEVGLTSKVKRWIFKPKHIPQIDLIGRHDTSAIIEMLTKLGLLSKVSLYDSGNSYHVWYHTVVSARAWKEFMHRLLLVNDQNNSMIDTRWVGNSLRQGYSLLRLTNFVKSPISYLGTWDLATGLPTTGLWSVGVPPRKGVRPIRRNTIFDHSMDGY